MLPLSMGESIMSLHWRGKRNSYGFLILGFFAVLLAPISYFMFPINLMGSVPDWLGATMSYVSHTAAGIGGLGTLLVILIWSFWRSGYTPLERINFMLQLGVLLALALILKTGIKELTQSPRPFTQTMTQALVLPEPSHFYKLDEAQKDLALKRMERKVSEWRIMNWHGEMNYSFPSGHTVFVAICLVFFGSLLLEQKRYVSADILLIWALLVAYSRLWLGMHRPEDLFGAIALVAFIYWCVPKHYPVEHPKLQPIWRMLRIQS